MDTETFKEELTSKLKNYAYLWQDELYIEDSHYHEYNDNVRHIMDSIGKEVESLALTVCNYFFGEGYEGSGSGGSGYDLINRKLGKGVEVKSCNLAQNVTCSCNRKYNPILFNACPTCGSIERKVPRDARFGIDAKETLRQLDKGTFDRFIFCKVELSETKVSKKSVVFALSFYSVDFDDKELFNIKRDYFKNQVEKGSKPHCNLLPDSFDFYKLVPKKLIEVLVGIDFSHSSRLSSDEVRVDYREVHDNVRVPLSICKKAEKEIMKTLPSYDPLEGTVDCKEFTLNVPYRHKSLGKDRGDTTINKDKTLSN